MGKFLERHMLLTLTQEEIENLSKPITCNSNQNTIQTEKLRPRGFTGEFYQTFKKI